MDNFNSQTHMVVSAEVSELIALVTKGEFIPVPDSEAKITSVMPQESGQTLFMVEMDAMTEDENNDDDDPRDPKIKVKYTFPLTVNQIAKMVKLAKKQDKANGIIPPVKANPNAKKPVPPPAPAEDDGYDPFASPADDF